MGSNGNKVDREAQFWENAAIVPFSECWEWLGGKLEGGYGYMGIILAHRFSYSLFKGPLKKGLCVDHLCRNRSCVNPAHLELVTQWENNRRGIGISAENIRKTHCKHGHPFSGENLWVTKDGKRRCRKCRKRWNKIHLKTWHQRKKAARQ